MIIETQRVRSCENHWPLNVLEVIFKTPSSENFVSDLSNGSQTYRSHVSVVIDFVQSALPLQVELKMHYRFS